MRGCLSIAQWEGPSGSAASLGEAPWGPGGDGSCTGTNSPWSGLQLQRPGPRSIQAQAAGHHPRSAPWWPMAGPRLLLGSRTKCIPEAFGA